MLISEIDSEELNNLKTAFAKLSTVEEKFNFWEGELKTPYVWHYGSSDYEPFWIKPQSPEDFETLNNLIYQDAIKHETSVAKNAITDLDSLIRRFNDEVLEVSDKRKFIEAEILNVTEEINFRTRPSASSSLNKPFNSYVNHMVNEENKRFVQAYKDWYFKNKEIDLSKEVYPVKYLVAYKNGKAWADYHKYLDAEIENATTRKSKKEISTLPKQLLLLYYLGFLHKVELSDSKKGLLFSVLLNGDSENIRKALPNFIGNQLRGVKNKKHLDEISALFYELGLEEEFKAVEKDIVKLKTAK